MGVRSGSEQDSREILQGNAAAGALHASPLLAEAAGQGRKEEAVLEHGLGMAPSAGVTGTDGAVSPLATNLISVPLWSPRSFFPHQLMLDPLTPSVPFRICLSTLFSRANEVVPSVKIEVIFLLFIMMMHGFHVHILVGLKMTTIRKRPQRHDCMRYLRMI